MAAGYPTAGGGGWIFLDFFRIFTQSSKSSNNSKKINKKNVPKVRARTSLNRKIPDVPTTVGSEVWKIRAGGGASGLCVTGKRVETARARRIAVISRGLLDACWALQICCSGPNQPARGSL